VASSKSKGRSRKRRTAGAAPRAAASQRRETRAERGVIAEREQRQAAGTLGRYGARPPGLFGGVPVSEIAIFAGGVGVAVGFISSATPALIVGTIVCTLGVVEVTAREHFSGYRSHTTMLAAVPAVAIGIAMISLFGGSLQRGPLLLVVVPVYAGLFWLLRKRFRTARQARVVKPPAP
jgi:hypothetical protein